MTAPGSTGVAEDLPLRDAGPDAGSDAATDAAAGEPAESLRRLLAREIAQPAGPAAEALAAEIRRRHGPAAAGVLFYGSCLRTGTGTTGVHDFYLLVDGYRAAYRTAPRRDGRRRGGARAALLALANRVLPPNVFYLELPCEGATLRAKYAVISTRDFVRAAGPRFPHALIWARFSQPFLLVWARDDATRDVAVRGAARALTTLLGRLVFLLPAAASGVRTPMAFVWEHVFRETYRAELRTESHDTIARIYASAHARFDRVATLTLRDLARRRRVTLEEDGAFLRLRVARGRRLRARLSWSVRRPLAKSLAAANLVKTAFTFGDWVPYALWKLERHTGARVPLTERQRRHPLLFGWPVIMKLLRERDLR